MKRGDGEVLLHGHGSQLASDDDELLLGAPKKQRQEGSGGLVNGDNVHGERFFQGVHACCSILLKDLDTGVVDKYVEPFSGTEFLGNFLDCGSDGVILRHV